MLLCGCRSAEERAADTVCRLEPGTARCDAAWRLAGALKARDCKAALPPWSVLSEGPRPATGELREALQALEDGFVVSCS